MSDKVPQSKQSDKNEQLIAAYLAGADVEEALIEQCKNDRDFAAKLAEDIAFSRIVAFVLQAKDQQVFLQEIDDLLVDAELLPEEKLPLKQNSVIEFPSQRLKALHRSALAACATVVIGLFVVFYSLQPQPVAIVNKVIGSQQNMPSLSEGSVVKSGRFSLLQGYAELALNNGVILLLEAPIELDFRSPDRLTLIEGNLVAQVPQQAIGFIVDTPSSEIVDLGTEFGVSVDKKGDSEVHVLTGEIKVRASQKDKFEHLVENQARSFDRSKHKAIITSQPQRFMRTLPGKSADDPDYLHWSFDQKVGNNVLCDGKGIAGKCYDAEHKVLDANNVGPTFTQGKFADAVYFNGQDGWLETEYAGVGGNKPRTVSFWLKLPKDFSVNNAFGILSWGLSAKYAAWQITPNPNAIHGSIGSIRIGTNHGVATGSTVLTDDQWHHIAIVLFGGTKENLSTHLLLYVDGQLEKTSSKSIVKIFTKLNHPESKPLIMGRNIAYDGNGNAAHKARFFKGWLDEVYVFDSALDQTQINNLMRYNSLKVTQ